MCSYLAAFAGAAQPHNSMVYQQKMCNTVCKHPSVSCATVWGTAFWDILEVHCEILAVENEGS